MNVVGHVAVREKRNALFGRGALNLRTDRRHCIGSYEESLAMILHRT